MGQNIIPRMHKLPIIDEDADEEASNIDARSEQGITSARSLEDVSETYTS